jgi:hypothetical protein
MATALAFGQDVPRQGADNAPVFTRVQVDVLVVDTSGRPVPGIMVQAQAVGKGAPASLTDKDGRCGLELRTGSWIIKAIRLPEGELSRTVLEAGDKEQIELTLQIGGDEPVTAVSGESPDTDNSFAAMPRNDLTREISADSLGELSAMAAAELSKFTETVLIEARHKIIDRYASNDFNTSYWIDHRPGLEEAILDAADRSNYRLNLDWNGKIVNNTVSDRQRTMSNLLSGGTVLSDVPVYVNLDIPSSQMNDGQNSMLQPQARTPGLNLPGLINAFLSSGQQSSDVEVGYDVSPGMNLKSQGTNNFRAFYNEINNHIVNLYRPLRANYNTQAFGPTDAIRGVEFGVEKTFMGGLRALVRYSYNEAGGLNIRTINLFFEDWQDFENFLESGLRRDLTTALEAKFGTTDTKVQAIYRMYLNDVEDVHFSDRISNLMSEHSRIDLSLNQKINFGILSSARISFNLAVNNLLNSTRNSFLVSPDLDEDLSSRKLLGGIRIEF